MQEHKSHDLFDFMFQISQEMSLEYERIQKRATEDSGTAGDQGEENWKELLQDWLPTTCQIVTKGRIISHDGKTSPQVDVIVLKSSYPKKLLNKKLYLADGVIAIFECKVTLKAAHITEALKNCIAIKSLFTPRKGSPFKELNSPILYGLLAHSHSWKSNNSKPVQNIENKLIAEDRRLVKHPRDMIDLICVADLGVWASLKNTFLISNERIACVTFEKIHNQSGQSLVASTAYLKYLSTSENQVKYFQPIGALIFQLFYKLALENEEFRSLANYYQKVNIGGSGSGRIREWLNDIYSDEVKTKIERHLIGVDRITTSANNPWDEWKMQILPY